MVQVVSRKSTPTRNHRQDSLEEEDDGGDEMKCTGKGCKSCAAGCIADCVAVCCCPCAVINILLFAFFKLPYTIGKRIFKHQKNKKKMRKRDKVNYQQPVPDCPFPMKLDGNYNVEKETSSSGLELSGVVEESLKKNSFTTRYEEEELFFELYQDFYLGFGRVSFTDNS